MLPKIDCYYVPSLELGETIATELLNQLSGKKNTDLSKNTCRNTWIGDLSGKYKTDFRKKNPEKQEFFFW